MNVWFVLPSIRPVDEIAERLRLWKHLGYKVAVMRQGEPIPKELADFQMPTPEYRGWPASCNILTRQILNMGDDLYDAARWFVYGGDDQNPDVTHTAQQIAEECEDYFLDLAWPRCWNWTEGMSLQEAREKGVAYQTKQALWSAEMAEAHMTYGVMQPTGDRYSGNGLVVDIDTAAASPWVGRSFVRNVYDGLGGPFCEAYYHFYADRELKEVAERRGIYWARQDLTQIHDHWSREDGTLRPEHMKGPIKRVNADLEMYEYRKSTGFKGIPPMSIKRIHIAPDLGYLFPETSSTARVLCGRLAKDVLDGGEFIGPFSNLNPKCDVCPQCKERHEREQ